MPQTSSPRRIGVQGFRVGCPGAALEIADRLQAKVGDIRKNPLRHRQHGARAPALLSGDPVTHGSIKIIESPEVNNVHLSPMSRPEFGHCRLVEDVSLDV